MKKVKLKSSLLAALTSLLFLFLPKLQSRALPDITKPYLGEYECKIARFGGNDLLEEFSYIKLELKADNTFVLRYKAEERSEKTETGKYKYDNKNKEITFTLDRSRIFKRKFPLEKGVIYVDFPIGTKQILLTFEQK